MQNGTKSGLCTGDNCSGYVGPSMESRLLREEARAVPVVAGLAPDCARADNQAPRALLPRSSGYVGLR